MFGHSYRRVQISLAWEAHSSPRRKGRAVLFNAGFAANRAETAQTERTKTGGRALFLDEMIRYCYHHRNRILLGVKGVAHFSLRIKLGLCKR
jgi:hypothetical protein